MEWMAILKIVMAVIAMIMEMLGGGRFDGALTPDQQVVYHLASYQWNCGSAAWSQPGSIQNGAFTGTVEIKCNVEGTNGGGILTLRQHMLDQLTRSSSQVHEGPIVKNFEGLPSHAYDHSVVLADGDRYEYEMRGETNIATNGSTELRNVFRATTIPPAGDLRYLKGLEDAVEVTASASQPGWYEIKLVTKSTVAKPWYVSNETFLKAVEQALATKLENRRERILNDLASQL